MGQRLVLFCLPHYPQGLENTWHIILNYIIILNLFDLKISFMIQEALLLDPALSVETSQSKICQSISYPDIQVPSNY